MSLHCFPILAQVNVRLQFGKLTIPFSPSFHYLAQRNPKIAISKFRIDDHDTNLLRSGIMELHTYIKLRATRLYVVKMDLSANQYN